MGTLTKVFLVLNLVLSIAFVTVAATVLAQRAHWKERSFALEAKLEQTEQDLEKAKRTARREMEKLQQECQTARENAADLEGQVQDLKAMVAERDDTILAEKKRADEQTNLAEGFRESVSKLTAGYERIEGQLEQARQELVETEQNLDRANTARAAIEARVARYQLDHKDLLRRINELESQLDWQQRYAKVVEAIAPASAERARNVVSGKPGGEVPPKVIRGTVKQVDMDMGVVVLNCGRDNDPPVKKGYEFLVHRDGKLVAVTRVTTVDSKMCAARIVDPSPQSPVKVGDSAFTRF
jgi:hypothetical protein